MKKKVVIQSHHLAYDPEITVLIHRGEHWLLTQLQRRKRISKGFIKSLKVFVALNEDSAEELRRD